MPCAWPISWSICWSVWVSACSSGKSTVVRFFAWLVSIVAWFWSDWIWLLICCERARGGQHVLL